MSIPKDDHGRPRPPFQPSEKTDKTAKSKAAGTRAPKGVTPSKEARETDWKVGIYVIDNVVRAVPDDVGEKLGRRASIKQVNEYIKGGEGVKKRDSMFYSVSDTKIQQALKDFIVEQINERPSETDRRTLLCMESALKGYKAVTCSPPWNVNEGAPRLLPKGWERHQATEDILLEHEYGITRIPRKETYFTYEGKIAIDWNGDWDFEDFD